jgi:hypothetical protein
MRIIKCFVVSLIIITVVGLGFAVSGIYNVSARVPHFAFVAELIETVLDRSIAHYSNEIQLPSFDRPDMAPAGSIHFDATCWKCHGAPGREREDFALGLYPVPPPLNTTANELNRKEIFWIISNGIKLTGMPAFSVNHKPEEIAAITAFIEKLPSLDAGGYQQFVGNAKAH